MPQKTGIFESEKKGSKALELNSAVKPVLSRIRENKYTRKATGLAAGVMVLSGFGNGKAAAQTVGQQADEIFFGKSHTQTEISIDNTKTARQTEILENLRKELSGKAKRSTSTNRSDSLQNKTNAPIAAAAMSEDSVPGKLSYYDYLADMDFSNGWPDTQEFIAAILKKNPKINFETVYVTTLENIKGSPALYNHKTDSITVYIHKMSDVAHSQPSQHLYNEHSGKGREFTSRDLAAEVDRINSMIPVFLMHELVHRINAHLFLKYGFTISEFAKSNIVDEVSARIGELLFRRKIFINSQDLATAFRFVLNEDKDAALFWQTSLSGCKGYADFLTANEVGDVISPAEMDAILESAIKMFDMPEVYKRQIPAITEANIFRYKNPYGYLKHISDYDCSPAPYEDAVRMMLSYGRADFTDAANGGAARSARLDKYADGFLNGRNVKKPMQKIQEKYKESDMHQGQFRDMYQNIKNKSAFDSQAALRQTSASARIER